MHMPGGWGGPRVPAHIVFIYFFVLSFPITDPKDATKTNPKPNPMDNPHGTTRHTYTRVDRFVIPLIILLTDRGEKCAYICTGEVGIFSRNIKPQCIHSIHGQKRTPPD